MVVGPVGVPLTGGGPTREFLTLILQHIHDSQLMCSPDNDKFLSFNGNCLEENDYFIAGLLVAMALVHGGQASYFLSPLMFEAIIGDQTLRCHCTMSMIVSLSVHFQALLDADTVEKAKESTVEGNLSTVLDLAGTLEMPIETLVHCTLCNS